MSATQLDVLVDELALVAGRIEREAGLRLDAIVSEIKRIDAERALAFANLCRDVGELKQQLVERLDSIKDGEPGPKGDAGEPGKDGASVTVEDVAPLIASEVARAVAALPAAEKGEPGPKGEPGKDGKDGASVTVEDVAPLIASEVARAVAALPAAEKGEPGPKGEPGEPGKDGAPGLLPIAKAWVDKIHYAGMVVTHEGATWQASCDTGKQPPHEDWICIAAAGAPGKDGRSPVVRGTFDPAVTDYCELNVVALNGAAFIARRDNPGVCPGEGWQVISTQGKSGKPGDRGAPGPKGEPGPPVVAAHVDGQGLITIVNADGSKVELDLYPLLAKVV